jgi:hypothetical protein
MKGENITCAYIVTDNDPRAQIAQNFLAYMSLRDEEYVWWVCKGFEHGSDVFVGTQDPRLTWYRTAIYTTVIFAGKQCRLVHCECSNSGAEDSQD